MKHFFVIESHIDVTISWLVFVHQCAEYQSRRGEEKRKETERRAALLSREPEDITPANKGNFVWSQSSDIDKFE